MKSSTSKSTPATRPDPKQPGPHHVSSVALSCWNAFRYAQIMVADEATILEILQTYWDSPDVSPEYVRRGCRYLVERGWLVRVEGGLRPAHAIQLPGSGKLVAVELVRTQRMTELAVHPAVRYSRGAEFVGRGHNDSHATPTNPDPASSHPPVRMRRGRGGL